MNEFDEHYEIRKANKDDIDAIMKYIDEDWRKGHIMSVNKELFEYEFLEEDDSVNMVLAINRENGRIDGIMGYLCASNCPDKKDIWGSIWKVRDGSISLLGVEIMRRMEEISGCRYHLGMGANPKTNIPLVRVMFKRTGAKLSHYYMLGSVSPEDMRIAKITNLPSPSALDETTSSNTYSFEVRKITNPDDLKPLFATKACLDAVPYKDLWYINKRFFNHPISSYDVYGIFAKESGDEAAAYSPVAAFVTRVQEANDSSVLRIVDYIGEESAITAAGPFIKKLLDDNNYEYADFYCFGIDDEHLKNGGFICLKDGDENIIPNYFKPFLQENIDIWVHYPVNGARFCKADGDQDRPN